jgi:sigma-B regulation protein RsbU (phosphoserine phosphatase)
MTALAMLQNDVPALIVGVALCTIAAGLFAFGLLGRRIANIDLPIAGAFAALYGIRLIMRTQSITSMLGDPAWLHYVHSDLEYLVPVPGALLFQRFFGGRLRWLNRIATIAFVLCAAIGIPYDIVTHHPGALLPVNNAIVLFFLATYLINIVMPAPGESQDWRVLRAATAIFGFYVINAHFNFVRDRYGFSSEPVGFLIFIGTIVFTLMRHAVRTQLRVASVDGELAAARQIQMSILPKAPPSIRGLDLDAVYAPASEVAGDFYEFVPIDERCVGILVADVSGHGVPAALVASMLKVAVAGHTEHARHPARLLHELNAFFCGKLERQFITATYTVIDAGNGLTTVASAGHPSPLLIRGDRSVEEIAADGVLLGRFPSASYSERSTPIGNGDTLVLYTDGITEALSAGGEMWGESRFFQSLAAGASAQQVLDTVRSWSTPLGDDITLVIAKCVQS